METVDLVLLDTKSIQQYVFAGNMLKLNLGASYNVSHIYREDLLASAGEAAGQSWADVSLLDEWRRTPASVRSFTGDLPFEVGYVGGGNALLIFKAGLGNTFVENWTLRLLRKYPGLRTGVACGQFAVACLQGDSFGDALKDLFHRLAENKSGSCPVTSFGKYGITMDCALDSDGCETWHSGDNLDMFVSAGAESKLASSRKAREELQERYASILGSCEFPSELDDLGQHEGENHVAVVHVDGNGMSERVMACKSLVALRNLSLEIAEATEDSFRLALTDLVDAMDSLEATREFTFSRNAGHRFVPLRPLVAEGDDRTFVTDARIALYFTEQFMRAFARHLVGGRPVSSGAGIAIVKTSYPFYRAYSLAEELCEASKNTRNAWQWTLPEDSPVETSWLDFYIAYGGLSGDLASIRDRQYVVDGMRLHDGPYCLEPGPAEADWPDLDGLVGGVQFLSPASGNWPHSKVKELRNALSSGRSATEAFLNDMSARGLRLPQTRRGQSAWIDRASIEPYRVTPYFDMAELVDLYPATLLARRKKTRNLVPEGAS